MRQLLRNMLDKLTFPIFLANSAVLPGAIATTITLKAPPKAKYVHPVTLSATVSPVTPTGQAHYCTT